MGATPPVEAAELAAPPAEEAADAARDVADEAPDAADDMADDAPAEADDMTDEAPEDADDIAPDAPDEADDMAPAAPEEAEDMAPDAAEVTAPAERVDEPVVEPPAPMRGMTVTPEVGRETVLDPVIVVRVLPSVVRAPTNGITVSPEGEPPVTVALAASGDE